MSKRTGRRPLVGGLLALTMIALIGAAGAAGFILAPAERPTALATPQPVGDIPVTSQPFDDRRNVELSLTTEAKRKLVSPAAGMVTESGCTPGGTVTSGTAFLWLDEKPIIGLATRIPLYRDMDYKTKGDDVKALQQELNRLGMKVGVHGEFNWTTWNAYRKLVVQAGGKVEDGKLARAQVMWLPEHESRIDSCEVQVGKQIQAELEVATLPAALRAAQIKSVPGDAVPGARVLLVDGRRIPMEANGRITDPAALTDLAATPAYATHVNSNGQTALGGAYVLAEPIEVVSVPPSALYDLKGQQGCVVGDGKPTPVRIVGSQLGRTFVTWDSPVRPTVVRPDPQGAAPCK